MYNDIRSIMNEVFPGSAQPIQAQMTGLYLKIFHERLVGPHILGLEVLRFIILPAERIWEMMSLYFLSVHRGK